VAVPLAAGLQFIFVISLLLRTACTDPGILPRSEKDEVLYNERLALISSRWITEVKNART
jgi:hypothetical protein